MASESFRGLSRLRALADGLCGRGGLAVEPATPHDTGMTLNDLLEFAGRLADAAGDAIRPHFRTRFDVETKTGSSPVTVADRAAEAAMRALIESAFPADGIIGEEYGNGREDAGRVWVLDPIDRSEEHTSELQSLMRISYAVFCLKNKKYIDICPLLKHTTKSN